MFVGVCVCVRMRACMGVAKWVCSLLMLLVFQAQFSISAVTKTLLHVGSWSCIITDIITCCRTSFLCLTDHGIISYSAGCTSCQSQWGVNGICVTQWGRCGMYSPLQYCDTLWNTLGVCGDHLDWADFKSHLLFFTNQSFPPLSTHHPWLNCYLMYLCDCFSDKKICIIFITNDCK